MIEAVEHVVCLGGWSTCLGDPLSCRLHYKSILT